MAGLSQYLQPFVYAGVLLAAGTTAQDSYLPAAPFSPAGRTPGRRRPPMAHKQRIKAQNAKKPLEKATPPVV